MHWIKLILFCTVPIAISREVQNHASNKLIRKRRNTEQGRIDETNNISKEKLKFHVHFLPKPKEKLNAPRRVSPKLVRPMNNPLIRQNDVTKTITTPQQNTVSTKLIPADPNKILNTSSKERDTKNITAIFFEETDDSSKSKEDLKPITKIDNSEFHLEAPVTESVNMDNKNDKKLNNTEDSSNLEKNVLERLPMLIEAILGAKYKHEHHIGVDLDTSSDVKSDPKIDSDHHTPPERNQDDGIKVLLLETINQNESNNIPKVIETQDSVKREKPDIISIKQHDFTEIIESHTEANNALAFEEPVVANGMYGYDRQMPTYNPYSNTYNFDTSSAKPYNGYDYRYPCFEDVNGYMHCNGPVSPDKVSKSWVNTEVVIKSAQAKPKDLQINPHFYPQTQTRRSFYNNYYNYGNPSAMSYPGYGYRNAYYG